ncbi:MAG: prolipoprotein diacylglyceryl transferase [Hyphomicrobiaceae bacterium]|nr:prolipoprotein diacylglyceryl transferase [Hyphomicrobiaceae bacterium]
MEILAIPFPNIDPVAISIGPLSVKWYGLAYMAGLLLGWLYVKRLIASERLWARDRAPLSEPMIDDLLLLVTFGVVIGGRLGHVLFYEPQYYLSRPLEIFKIWQGGMAFHGGVLGVALAIWAFSRWRGAGLLSVADVVTAAVPIGLFFGRIANFINSEVVGTVSSVPWAIAFPGYGDAPRHPAMLYEALLEGAVLFAILYWLIHKRGSLKLPGLTVGAFLAGYGLFRIVCELFKIEEYRILFDGWPITRGMAYSVPMVLLGAYFIRRARRAAIDTEASVT